MAYMNQDKKRVIKAAIDKIAKPLGIKYSLRVHNHSAIICTITAAPIDFIGNFKMTTGDKFSNLPSHEIDHLPVNPYWYQDHFTGKPREIIGQLIDALKAAGYYDNSDAMIDYFDTAYYLNLNIGDYKRPFKLTAPTIRQAGALISEEAIKAKILAMGCDADFVKNKVIVRVFTNDNPA